MRILIDVPPIVKAGGSTRHLQNFIMNLDKTISDNTYLLAIDGKRRFENSYH